MFRVKGMSKCVRCGIFLKKSEIAANWNDEWFACFPCWDESEGFIGWKEGDNDKITQYVNVRG